jgi:hypothetical protein
MVFPGKQYFYHALTNGKQIWIKSGAELTNYFQGLNKTGNETSCIF